MKQRKKSTYHGGFDLESSSVVVRPPTFIYLPAPGKKRKRPTPTKRSRTRGLKSKFIVDRHRSCLIDLAPVQALICVVVYLTHRDHGHNSTKAAKEVDEEVERYVVVATERGQGWHGFCLNLTYLVLLRLQ
jgi:hypothetical protein